MNRSQITQVDKNRVKLLAKIGALLDKYESSHPLKNDVGCLVRFFDGKAFRWNGEEMLEDSNLES